MCEGGAALVRAFQSQQESQTPNQVWRLGFESCFGIAAKPMFKKKVRRRLTRTPRIRCFPPPTARRAAAKKMALTRYVAPPR